MVSNPHLELDDVNAVLSSGEPLDEYEQIVKNANYTRALRQYQHSAGRTATPFEIGVLGNITLRTTLTDSDIIAITRTLTRVDKAHSEAQTFLTRLQNRQYFIERGVREETIDRLINRVDTLLRTISSAGNTSTAGAATTDLQTFLKDADNRLDYEQMRFTVTTIVDEVYGEELREDFGPQIRDRILNHIVSSVNAKDIGPMRLYVETLHKLDKDLQAKVIGNDIRLYKAIEVQKARNIETIRQSFPPVPERPADLQETTLASELPKPPTIEVYKAVESPVAIPLSPEEEERELPGLTSATQKERIRKNNEQLRSLISNYKTALRLVDLKPTEVEAETLKELLETMNLEGTITVGHPNIARIIINAIEDQFEKTEQLEQKVTDDLLRDFRTLIEHYRIPKS